MNKWLLLLTVVIALSLPAWLVLKTDNVSGDEFRSIYISEVVHAYSSWYLYKIDSDRLCFRHSRPVVPKKYCVPSSELSVRNSKDGKAELGFVTSKNLFVRNSNGASEEQIVVP